MAYTKRSRQMRKSTRSRRTAKNVRSLVQREIRKNIETKKNQKYDEEQAVSTLGGFYYCEDHMKLAQDDTYSGMSGHEVRGVGHQFKLMLHNNSAISLSVRILVLRNLASRTDYTSGTSLMENNAGNITVGAINSTAALIARINRDKYETVRDMVVRLSPANTDANDTKVLKLWVKDTRKYVYDGSNTLPRGNVFLFVFPAQNDTDTGSGVVCETTCLGTWYYKDG